MRGDNKCVAANFLLPQDVNYPTPPRQQYYFAAASGKIPLIFLQKIRNFAPCLHGLKSIHPRGCIPL